MYLKGSSYNYSSRRRRSSPFRILILLALVIGGLYFSTAILPDIDPLFIPANTPTTPPETYVNQGEQLFEIGRFADAIKNFSLAIDADPKNVGTYVSIARAQMYNGDYADALTNAENAILLNGNNAVAHALRGWALGKLGNYLDAESAYNRAYEIDPAYPQTYAYQTETLVDQISDGEDRLDTLDKATECSRRAVELGGQIMESHRARGLLLEITGNYDEAITEFEISITLNPNYADSYLALGRAFRATGQDSEAITAFERARSLSPYDPWAPYYISRTYSNNGEYAKAIQQGEDAIDLKPDETMFYWNLGTQYYRSGNYPKALKYFELSIRGGMTDKGVIVEGIPLSYENRVSELYYMYGIILARSGQCQEAAEVVRLLTQGVPDDETAILNAEYMTEICKEGDFDINLIEDTPVPVKTEEPDEEEEAEGEEAPESEEPES